MIYTSSFLHTLTNEVVEEVHGGRAAFGSVICLKCPLSLLESDTSPFYASTAQKQEKSISSFNRKKVGFNKNTRTQPDWNNNWKCLLTILDAK